MSFAIRRAIAVSLVASVVGCGNGGPDPASSTTPAGVPSGAKAPAGTMHLSGIVRWQSLNGSPPFPISSAQVKATIDRNRDGVITANETSLATASGDGEYTLDVPVDPGDTMVVRFAREGAIPVLRTVKAGPKGNLILDATLRESEPLECAGAACSTRQGGLTVKGLPAGTSGSARVFNPVTETDAFPGDFNESTGKLLVSGVFASFDLKDGSEKPLEKLVSPAELRLPIPRDTWSVVRDILPGNDRIDVPLYAFDEVKGTWVRDGTAHLEDGNANVIAPASLASIRDGSFTGVLHAVGNVSHFATWNVDWPIEYSCVSGRIVDDAGKPVEGATVILRGISYTGTSTPTTVGPDGTFCLEAMPSEAVGQDLDGNGKTGETAIVAISAVAGGKTYDLGEFQTPSAPGACGSTGCLALGDLRLGAATLRVAAVCTVSGTVKYVDGTPAEGAGVLAADASVGDEVAQAMCDAASASCQPLAFADASGSFSVSWPALDYLNVGAIGGRALESGASELLVGSRKFTFCPKAPIVLTLNTGFIEVDYTISVVGNSISWTPSRYGISHVQVKSAAGELKWEISTDPGKVLGGPLEYGPVPAGATQTYPPRGAPAPLAGDDIVSIGAIGGSIDGLPYFGSGIWIP